LSRLETKSYDSGYFKGKTSPINYESVFHRITVWLRFRTMMDLLKSLNRDRGILMDVGCAFGDFVSKFSEKGFEAFGCDVSKWATAKAKKLHPETSIIRADANFLPFKNNVVDIVTMLETLEHCPHVHNVLDEIHRIVAPTGLVVFSVPTTDLNDTHADQTHIWHLTLKEWIKLLEKEFCLVKVKYFLKSFRHVDRKASNTFIALETRR
jgi:ubiquinone/menaquinone biosynthesis C-methylase UbiE